MKKTLFTFIFFVSISILYAQVAINNDGSSPDASAVLDVQSTEKGMLVPRMNTAQRTAISNPATGLFVYDSETLSFWFFNGNGWQEIKKGEELWTKSSTNTILENNGDNVGIGTVTPDEKLHVNYGNIKITGDDQNLLSIIMEDENSGNEYSISAYEEIRLNTNSTARLTIETDGRIGIGTTNPASSAILEISSTNQGMLPPRMSTNQMNSISSPTAGLLVFNTTVNMLFCYNGESWKPTMNNDGMSCGTISYGGQSYNTVIIGTQCWLAENLNIGTRVDGEYEQTDNGNIEKYCYDNLESNCDTYGGLYQWDEMMQYTTEEGTQGICPMGWHLPDDEEWKTLEGYVDSKYKVGDGEWDNTLYRGFDVGLNLKSENIWASGGYGDDLYDFSAEPGGLRVTGGIGVTFSEIQAAGLFWTSSTFDADNAWRRLLGWSSDQVSRLETDKEKGFSVRCIKD
ncbi:MAG: hypothetical protein K9G67_06700 [Bacteroidales bacterium]|nr:hypothetical protein [Bacteroidales bacterium]MCF8349587.1 hypothetical protein [Bacteroidales bacterium]MCF8376028.1 hypothetical protein [Bacteroidales bacterium]MCF8400439.1 hypothetical protein [Bacteroidales bacterium]